jgi:hypothetical protein
MGVEGPAVDEFHDEVGQAVRGDAAVEEAGDEGVLVGGEDLAFGGEAAAGVIGVEAAAEEFDGGGHGELAVGAFGDPDGAHAAGGERFQEAPGTEKGTLEGRDRGGGTTGVEEEGGRVDGFFEASVGFGRDAEEFENGVEDAGFAGALLFEEGAAVGRRQAHGLVEEFLDAKPAWIAHCCL